MKIFFGYIIFNFEFNFLIIVINFLIPPMSILFFNMLDKNLKLIFRRMLAIIVPTVEGVVEGVVKGMWSIHVCNCRTHAGIMW